jgi:hypothetical protein
MAPCTLSIKFSYDTQFTFVSLMFNAEKDRNLELLTRGPPQKHPASVYGQALYLPTCSSTSGSVCSYLNPYTGSYHRTAKTGISIEAPIFQPSAGTSSYSSVVSPGQDFTDDYPKIRGSTYWNSTDEGRLIIMVAPIEAPSQNNSSRYSTIGRSEASDAQTPGDRLVRNLNLDFNTIRLQNIMESIQRMVSEGSPLIALAQQGVVTANHVIAAERLADNHRGEPYISNRSDGRAKQAQSEAPTTASGNRHLGDNDARWRITQNYWQREYDHDRDDLCNIIDDRRHLRARSPTPLRRSPTRDVTTSGSAISTLWLHRSGRSFGQRSSRLDISTNMTDLAILKSSSRSIIQSLRS